MPSYIAKRLLQSLFVLLAMAIVVFLGIYAIGNPADILISPEADQSEREQVMRQMGLDLPLAQQLGKFLLNALHGDLGNSFVHAKPAMELILERLPATLELVLFAMALIILVGIPLGILAAVRRGSWWDHSVQAIAQLGASVPNFWFGLLLIFFLFFLLPAFPPPLGRLDDPGQAPLAFTGLLLVDSLLAGSFRSFISALWPLILPGLTLAAGAAPATIKITRDTLSQILTSDYIRTPIAYGVDRRTVYFRYALKNALVPVTTVLAMTMGFLMSGTVLVETVFSWPGLGLYAVTAMNHFDYEPIIAVVLISAVFYAGAYLIADLLHFMIDPRLRVR